MSHNETSLESKKFRFDMKTRERHSAMWCRSFRIARSRFSHFFPSSFHLQFGIWYLLQIHWKIYTKYFNKLLSASFRIFEESFCSADWSKAIAFYLGKREAIIWYRITRKLISKDKPACDSCAPLFGEHSIIWYIRGKTKSRGDFIGFFENTRFYF